MSPASVITGPGATRMHTADTPPDSPLQSSSQLTIFVEVTQDLVDKLQLLVPSKAVVEGSSKVQITEISSSEESKPKEARPRASKVDYKNVNEVYVVIAFNITHANSMVLQVGQEVFQLYYLRTCRGSDECRRS
jgi:hypothetical protein